MIKRYLVVFIIFWSSFLHAEVSKVVPFSAILNFDSNSFNDSGTINGVYLSTGTLGYLAELTYAHTDIRYKYLTKNLTQDEYSMSYSKYFLNYSYKVGLHTNTTTDTDLQNGTTLMLGFNKYKWRGKNKLSAGADLYYSYYTNGTDLDENNASIGVTQISLNVSYYASFDSFANYISLRGSYEDIPAYNKNHVFAQIQNILYYKGFEFELGYIAGSMQTGILDNGSSVYNSKDVMHQKFTSKISYNATPSVKIDLSYSNSVYDEYNNKSNLSNNTVALSVGYKI